MTTERDSNNNSNSGSESEGEQEVHGCAVLVQNLTTNVHRSQLTEIFGTYGRVRAASVRSVCAGAWHEGVVEFSRPEHATQACLFMDGGQIDGLTVRVSVLPDRSSRGSSSSSSRSSRSSSRSSSASPRSSSMSSRSSSMSSRSRSRSFSHSSSSSLPSSRSRSRSMSRSRSP